MLDVLRTNKILECLIDHPEGLTSREVTNLLGFIECNSVRPTLTRLKQKGIVNEIGKKYDTLTKRKVTVYQINKAYYT